jgi:hypothetical protein
MLIQGLILKTFVRFVTNEALFPILLPIIVREKQKMSNYWMIYYANKGSLLKELIRGLTESYLSLINLESLIKE